MPNLLIKNTTVIDGTGATPRIADILINGGHVARISGHIEAAGGCEIIDGTGKYACPGFVDLHAHLREPGFEYKEDIATATAAAAAGGYTAVLCMPNTKPPLDNAETLKYVNEKARGAKCRVYPIGAITKGQSGLGLTDFAELAAAGAIAFSDDGRPVEDPRLMRDALIRAAAGNYLIISHSEDPRLAGNGKVHAGEALKKYNETSNSALPGIPASAEDAATARDLILAAETGARLHIAHVSTAMSAKLVAFAKQNGARVTAETCPHYFALCDGDALRIGADAKMNPPLRSRADHEAIVAALADGTLDCIATDHAPHSAADKAGGLERAANGIIGLESAFAVSYTYLVRPGHISLPRLVELMSTAPARVAGFTGGTLREGGAADLTVFDINEKFTFDKNKSLSKSRNTPFHGHELYGKILYTVRSGEITYQRHE